MLASLLHKDSYVHGLWADRRMGVYVGWAERQGSFSSQMPLRNERGDKILIFSGEEYPDPGIHAQLKERGHVLETNRADYLVHLSEEDPRFPRSLNGRFQGILVDQATSTATLFNDRYGMQRLYYHESEEVVYFGAEAKAILAVVPELRRPSSRGIGEFIACGCVLENRTIFPEIYALPGGSAWVFESGTLQHKGRYFDPAEWENQERLEPVAYYDRLRDVFSTNLARYLSGPEKIAISLTGGLDTRMIMAWAPTPPNSLPGYTFGGPYRECQDVVIARKVAQVCEQPYQVIPVGADFLSRFADYAERTVYCTDGCAPVNRAADLYANEIAADIAPVRLTGNYGSEILRHLRAFKPSSLPANVFAADVAGAIGLAKETYDSLLSGHAVSFTAFRQAPWYQYGLLCLEQTQLTLRSPFLDNDLVRTAYQAPHSEIVRSDIFEDNSDCSRLIHDGSPALHGMPTDRGLGGDHRWWTPALRAYQEFTFKAEYAYDYGMPQWLSRVDHAISWMKPERLFLGRHKFCHYRVWYRDALSRYVREMLLDPLSLSRPYINRRGVETLVRHHLRGDRNYTTAITTLLTLELQHRLFLDAHYPVAGSTPLAAHDLHLTT